MATPLRCHLTGSCIKLFKLKSAGFYHHVQELGMPSIILCYNSDLVAGAQPTGLPADSRRRTAREIMPIIASKKSLASISVYSSLTNRIVKDRSVGTGSDVATHRKHPNPARFTGENIRTNVHCGFRWANIAETFFACSLTDRFVSTPNVRQILMNS